MYSFPISNIVYISYGPIGKNFLILSFIPQCFLFDFFPLTDSSSAYLNHLFLGYCICLFLLKFNSISLLSMLVLSILAWPGHCNRFSSNYWQIMNSSFFFSKKNVFLILSLFLFPLNLLKFYIHCLGFTFDCLYWSIFQHWFKIYFVNCFSLFWDPSVPYCKHNVRRIWGSYFNGRVEFCLLGSMVLYSKKKLINMIEIFVYNKWTSKLVATKNEFRKWFATEVHLSSTVCFLAMVWNSDIYFDNTILIT